MNGVQVCRERKECESPRAALDGDTYFRQFTRKGIRGIVSGSVHTPQLVPYDIYLRITSE